MRQRVERVPPLVDQHAKREQRRAADAVLAVDEHLLASARSFANEGDAALEMLEARRLQIRRGQMQKLDPRALKFSLVVAIFGSQIDHRRNSVRKRELAGALDRKASPERHGFAQPVKIRPPLLQASIFFFNIHRIFFFIH